MMETWHPLGVVGVISAFNFPVAVWSWNAALAFVCGDAVVWKPSEKTPLTALAVQALFERAAERFGDAPAGLCERRHRRARRRRGAGRPSERPAGLRHRLHRAWAARRRSAWPPASPAPLLELGGNNAAIVAPTADLDLALARPRLRRDGHGRPALHDAAPPVRA